MECKLGCFNRPWNKWDLARALKGISQAGFEYVGLLRQKGQFVISGHSSPEEVQAVARMINIYNLKPVIIMASVPTEISVAEAAEQLKMAIKTAKQLGANYVLTTGCADPQKYGHYLDVISACTQYAAEKGIIITLKPHGGLSATGKDCLKAIRAVNAETFRIWYDPGNILFYAGVRPERDVIQVAEYVVGLCIKDSKGGKGGTVEISPGDGDVNFEAILKILLGAGFSGPCLVETLSGNTPEEIDAEARKAYDFLNGLLEKL